MRYRLSALNDANMVAYTNEFANEMSLNAAVADLKESIKTCGRMGCPGGMGLPGTFPAVRPMFFLLHVFDQVKIRENFDHFLV